MCPAFPCRRVLERSGPKWVLTAMHDVSIAPVLGALGVYDNRWPPLASHIVFEVWGPPPPPSGRHESLDGEATFACPPSPPTHPSLLLPPVLSRASDFRVRLLFNGADITHRLACYHRGSASEMCTWPEFVQLVTPLQQWKAACEAGRQPGDEAHGRYPSE